MTTKVGKNLRNVYDTVALAKADPSLRVGESIQILERGEAFFDVVAYEGGNLGYDRIDNDAGTLTFALRFSSSSTITEFGYTTDIAPVIERMESVGVRDIVIDQDCDLASTATLPSGVTVRGINNGGTGATQVNEPIIKVSKTFSGAGFVFDGSRATNSGTGGGVKDLTIKSEVGTGIAASGTAIVANGTSINNRSGFMRFENLNFEVSSDKDDFNWCIDINGTGVGGTDGVRDFWLRDIRMVSRGNADGSLRIFNAFNVYAANVECNLANAKISIDGTVGNESAGVYLSNCTAGTLEMDYCSFININGGSYTNLTTTANLSQVMAVGVFTSNFSPILGTSVTVNGYNTGNNRHFTANSGQSIQFYGKDNNAGDSSDLVAVYVGNLLSNQGVASFSYTNAAPTGSPRAKWAFTPRKNDDTGAIESASIEFQKIPGTDDVNIVLTNSDGAVIEALAGAGIRVGQGAWNDRPLLLGAYRLWVDATGDLRIKNGTPVSDTDGTVVGTQT